MLSNSVERPSGLTQTQEISRDNGRLADRKIWLPKLVYDALPYFYLIAGIAALLATLYISDWFWVLPHYLLFSAACLHLGVRVFRRRYRRSRQPSVSQDQS